MHELTFSALFEDRLREHIMSQLVAAVAAVAFCILHFAAIVAVAFCILHFAAVAFYILLQLLQLPQQIFSNFTNSQIFVS